MFFLETIQVNADALSCENGFLCNPLYQLALIYKSGIISKVVDYGRMLAVNSSRLGICAYERGCCCFEKRQSLREVGFCRENSNYC